MRALSIRQPYAEMILRGEKTIEYRSRPTKIIGERFYIYASRKWAGVNGHDIPVMPAQAGIQSRLSLGGNPNNWIPAFAGMTGLGKLKYLSP